MVFAAGRECFSLPDCILLKLRDIVKTAENAGILRGNGVMMKKEDYELVENYMLSCMEDSAHDKEHFYRVLYHALDIAKTEEGVDFDILISACLLHDIGRKEQFTDPAVCHAAAGAEKAYAFLTAHGFAERFAGAVRDCIRTHRFRKCAPPQSIEAKILFDADKVDVTGAVGIARTLVYKGEVAEPLYTLREDGRVSDGTGDGQPSFLQEYKYKLEGIYSHFYTARGAEMAEERKEAAAAFYRALYREADMAYKTGRKNLRDFVEGM